MLCYIICKSITYHTYYEIIHDYAIWLLMGKWMSWIGCRKATANSMCNCSNAEWRPYCVPVSCWQTTWWLPPLNLPWAHNTTNPLPTPLAAGCLGPGAESAGVLLSTSFDTVSWVSSAKQAKLVASSIKSIMSCLWAKKQLCWIQMTQKALQAWIYSLKPNLDYIHNLFFTQVKQRKYRCL